MTHYPLLEADLARYYQTDLPAALWGAQPISARRLGVLVRALPPESATIQAVAPAASWGTSDELLATLIELTDARWHWFFDVHAKPHVRRPAPVRIPRPGQSHTETPDDRAVQHGKTTRSPAEVATYLRRFRPVENDKEEVTAGG